MVWPLRMTWYWRHCGRMTLERGFETLVELWLENAWWHPIEPVKADFLKRMKNWLYESPVTQTE